MTQEEYLNMTDEAKNALFATGVLEWELNSPYFTMGKWDFDPINNLDHAFMGVDKLREDGLGNGCLWSLNRISDGRYKMILFQEARVEGVTGWAYGKTRNQAIMLACHRANGNIEGV